MHILTCTDEEWNSFKCSFIIWQASLFVCTDYLLRCAHNSIWNLLKNINVIQGEAKLFVGVTSIAEVVIVGFER